MCSAPDFRCSSAIWLLLLFLPLHGWGQWQMDEGFGNQGLIRFGTDTVTVPEAWLQLPGDSILLLSSTGPANASVIDRDLMLVKLGPNGAVDLNFGNAGILRFDFLDLDYSTGSDLIQDTDGSFLVLGSGYRFDSTEHVLGMLARVSRDGTVLPVSQEQFQIPLESIGYKEYPNAIAAMPGGGFVVVGSSLDPLGWHSQPIVMRLDADFKPDSSFAGTGKLMFDLDGGQALRENEVVHFSGGYFKDLSVLADGRITVVGGISNGLYLEGLLAQFQLDGSLEPSFNLGTGYARFDWLSGYDTRLTKLVQLADGTVLLGGSAGADAPMRGVLLGRFNPANGSHAHETIDIGGNSDLSDMVWVEGQEALLAVGTVRTDSGRSQAMAWLPDIEQMEVHEILHLYPGAQGYSEGKLGLVQTNGRILLAGTSRETALRSVGTIAGLSAGFVEVDESRNHSGTFQMFPSPVSERLTISSSEPLNEVLVREVSGQMVLKVYPGRLSVVELELGELPMGVYYLQVNGRFQKPFVVHR